MDLFDVLYVEDNLRDWGKPFLEISKHEMNLNGYLVQSFEELKSALDEGIRAKVYVVDGNFPRKTGGHEEKLAGEAIRIIKDTSSSQQNILILSSDSTMRKLAGEFGVDYMEKFEGINPMLDYAFRLCKKD